MSTLTFRVRAALLALVLTVLAPVRAIANDFFDASAIQTLNLTLHSRDWSDLHERVTSNDYYPADLEWRGIRVRNVGVRSRGLSTRYPAKPGLEISFDRYATHQRFMGLQSVVLDNLISDPSMLRERVSMAFLARVGVPAPRETFARLVVNGEYAGLYTLTEAIDPTFVQTHFGDTGALFEYRYAAPYYATDLGDDLDVYRGLFAPRNDTPRSTSEWYQPIRDLFRTINDAPDATFAADVQAQLDLNALIRLVAADVVLAEWDGLLGYDGMNNLYLYRRGAQSMLLPWDKDHAFIAADYPILAGTAENVLLRRLLNDPDLRTTFFDQLDATARAASDGDWLLDEVDRAYAVIREAALADPFKLASNDEFEQAVAELRAIARTRPAFVLNESRRLR